ncbi:tyrosine-type recombinase/integrase [Campylobacter sp. RM16192]|uniref:tyrosine-type recombinase/integrase n=1 Tax=Campylobacter sp. RM16192 TaxID=1660080 RepID=UPI0015571A1F|nr:site-specific integrase [Campylobacter sp. RM16192]
MINRHNSYILPTFGEMNVKQISYSDLYKVLIGLFNPKNPTSSRLETIHRIINDIRGILAPALRYGYITTDPTYRLHNDFPTVHMFNKKSGVDNRIPALSDEVSIAEFLTDLRNDNKMELSTRRAVYLQILTANRPINTVSVKWADIDLEKGLWKIPSVDMKMREEHIVCLSTYAVAVLKEQYMFSKNSQFVFPSVVAKYGHIHRDALTKAIGNLGHKNKYNGVATAHGFRATFKTICSLYDDELISLGITEKTVEECLAHKETNAIKQSYERNRSTQEKKSRLMQWYGDHLNSLSELGIAL